MKRSAALSFTLALALFSIITTVITTGFPVSWTICAEGSTGADQQAAVDASRSVQAAGSEEKARIDQAYGQLPLHFIENRGQMDGRVLFYEKGPGHSTFFTSDGIRFSIDNPSAKSGDGPNAGLEARPRITSSDSEPEVRQESSPYSIVDLTPVGMSKSVDVVAEGPQAGKVNYFIGRDPKGWHTNIPTYKSVAYREAYPGIDIKFHGTNRQLEYDLIVNAGADPSHVKFQVRGAEGLEVTEDGDLFIRVKDQAALTQRKPLVYQVIDGKRVIREGRFRIEKRDTALAAPSGQEAGDEGPSSTALQHQREIQGFVYGFEVASYDAEYPLIIDPYLVYSTFLGGYGADYGRGITVDSAGNAYVTGYTLSDDFPTMNPEQEHRGGGQDAFVTKIGPDGDALIYSTFLGGNTNDLAHAIAVDSSGSAYVTGYTASVDFPVLNAFQSEKSGGMDAFVTKLNAAGDTLVYSTYLGGLADDNGYGIAVDTAGNAYVAGSTLSDDFPVSPGAFQQTRAGLQDAFVTKLYSTGDALVYSTYLGGPRQDNANGIAVDSSGNAYVAGTTRSFNFPTRNAFQPKLQGMHAFVTKLTPQGDDLIYSTYLGGSDIEQGLAIAVDTEMSAYVTGYTYSHDFPTTPDAFQGDPGGSRDAFVTKLSPEGNSLAYSTFLGGSGVDEGHAIAVDVSGKAYVTGSTSSTDFPVWNPFQAAKAGGYFDAFVTKLNPPGTRLIYSTYLGGIREDAGTAICTGPYWAAYVTGYTTSVGFPTLNPFQRKQAGSQDAFISQIRSFPVQLTLTQPNGGENWPIGSSQTIKWTSSELNGNVKLELSGDGGLGWSTLFDSLPNSGSQTWKVAGPGTSNAKIRISSATTPEIQDMSDHSFTMSGIHVTSPNGGEIWIPGSRQTILWTSKGVTGNVRIGLSRDGGTSWKTLFRDIPNGGARMWTVTGPPTPLTRIKITSVANPAIGDVSDSDFAIAGITVTSPTGGEVWPIGSRQVIRWTAAGVTGNVEIELSRDGGSTWTTLLGNVTNDGSQAWIVTGPATTQALIRVKSLNDPGFFGTSRSVFTIQ